MNYLESLILNSVISHLSSDRMSDSRFQDSDGKGLIEKNLPLGSLTVTVYIVVVVKSYYVCRDRSDNA